MATLDVTAFDWALKTRYSPDVVKNMAYKDNPFFAMIKKAENFGGKNYVFGCQYGVGAASRSAAFSTAQSQRTPALGEDFILTRVKDYSVASIDSETIMASRGDPNALLEAVETEQDAKLHALIRSTAISLFRNGSGSIGQVTSVGASTTLTLTKAGDVTNFEKGMILVFAADEASALRDSGASLTVNAVDRDAGTLTMSANLNTISGLAANDHIFAKGDYVSASDRNKISGLDAWIPSSAPGATAFFGVNRSSDVTRLGGHRLTGTGKTVEEALYDVAVRIAREGGKPDKAFVAYEQYSKLATLLGSKVQYVSHKVAEVSFEGIRINGPRGPIDVIPDQNCQADVGWVLTMDTLFLKSLGSVPMILDLDGTKWHREDSADALQIRNAVFGNMGCNAPGWNGRTSLDT